MSDESQYITQLTNTAPYSLKTITKGVGFTGDEFKEAL
jgi:hypothetical protein